jgi:spore coat polysaccharide biosynthesis protein SpsF
MHNISQERENGALRLTLDTPEDLRVLTHIMEETQALQSGYKTIEDTLMQHPQWIAINSHIEQKKV